MNIDTDHITTIMANIVPLKFTAKLICVQTLLDLSGEGDREAAQRMLKQLQTGCFTAVSCGLLRRLVDRHPGKVTNSILSALASTHLRELKLKKCKYVSFTGLKNVLETCPLVTKLDLSECDQFSQPEVFHITSFLRPGITALSLENCLTVDNTVVQSILSYMKTLQHLNLAGCSKLTDDVFLLNETLQFQRETFAQLSQDRYDCALVSVDISCTTLTSTAVRHLATLTGPTLKHVNISWTGADTLALLYLSGYSRPAIVDLTLSDPGSHLDGPLKQSLLELKSTLNQFKLNLLRKERSKKGNYGDIPVNETSESDSLSSDNLQLEVRASLPSSKGHPEVKASVPFTNSDNRMEASVSSMNTSPEISNKLKMTSQLQAFQSKDNVFECKEDPEAGHRLQRSNVGDDVGDGVDLILPASLNGEKSDNILSVKSLMDILEEASDSDTSVDSTMEEGQGSDTESDGILSVLKQASGANGHSNDSKALSSDARLNLIGGTDANGQICDETVHFIGESDLDDLTSDVTVQVNDDSYSWSVDKCSQDTTDVNLSANETPDNKLSANENSSCEVCLKLKSTIAKCTNSLNHKKNSSAEMFAANKFQQYNVSSVLSEDSKSSKVSQNSPTSESLNNDQTIERLDNPQASETSQISHFNGFLQNILTSDLSADLGIPQERSQIVTLETKTELKHSESGSDLENSREERVETNSIDDDTGIKYSSKENVNSASNSQMIPTSGDRSVTSLSGDTVALSYDTYDNATVSCNEGVMLMTSCHGDGMTFDEDVPQRVGSSTTKCDDILISDETGLPLDMPSGQHVGSNKTKCDDVMISDETGLPLDMPNGQHIGSNKTKCNDVMYSDETGLPLDMPSGQHVGSNKTKCNDVMYSDETGLPLDMPSGQHVGSNKTKCDDVMYSDETGLPLDMPSGQHVGSNKTKCNDVMYSDETGLPLDMSGGQQNTRPEHTSVATGAAADVQYSNCDKSLNLGSLQCEVKFNPSVLQSSCQAKEVSAPSPCEPGAFFDLREHADPCEIDIVLSVCDSVSTEKATAMVPSSDLKNQGVQKACLSDNFNGVCKSLDNQVHDELTHFIQKDERSSENQSEGSQSQGTGGYLDESGEYCYPPENPPVHEPKPTNSHKNSENGEIENSIEQDVSVQFYQPDLISIDFKRIEYENTYKYNGLKCLKIFSTENKNLQKIKISWKDNLKGSMLEELAPLWPNITYISLIDCESLTSQSLVTLATKCKQIQTITLQGVTFIQDFAMIPFINNGCLECLNLAECRITDHTLVRMAKTKMEKMKELDLSWCDDTSSVGLDKLFEKSSDTLRKLSIRQLAANDKTLSLIACNFCYLTSLNMSSIDGISDEAIVNMVENIRTLEHVDFSWNLGVTNKSISALFKNCQRLQRADLAGLKMITSEPFLPLISDIRQWRRCQALLRLKLQERSAKAASADLGSSSDEEFSDIFLPHRSTVYATDLNYLNLEFCDQVSDNHLAEICIVCRSESLTIYNYYGELVKPELFVGQGRKWYSNYIPATDE